MPLLPLLLRRSPAAHLVAGAVLLGLPSPAGAAPSAPAQAELSLRAGGAWLADLQPPWWTRPRSRGQVELEAWWRPSPLVGLGASFDAHRADRYPDGSRQSGPGDLRLHTDLRLWEAVVDGRLRWQVKLPNADDELELGSDETDIHLGLELVSEQGPARLAARGGVAVLGDPLRATAQAWLPELSLEAALRAGPVVPRARLEARLGSAALPAQATLVAGLEGGCPWLVGTEGLTGLSPAAPTWGLRAWVGWGFGCSGGG